MIAQIESGHLCLGDLTLNTTETNGNWCRERVPLKNLHMSGAGYVLSKGFHRDRGSMKNPLLAPKMPYYPDFTEAVKHWLPFAVYHGGNDSRNGEIVFFLPETRAFFVEVNSKEGSVEIVVDGSKVDNLDLTIIGACWQGNDIRHFEETVINGKVELNVPSAVKRLEYVLMDNNAIIYDYQREDEYGHLGLGRNCSFHPDGNHAEVVGDACQRGEGETVEFKPFVRLDDKFKGSKLEEVVKTVVAFANTKGGRIFLGIDDECNIVGLNEGLQRLTQTIPSIETCEKYLNTLKSEIRNRVTGDPDLKFFQILINDMIVGLIEVEMANQKPIEIAQDQYLYIRRGASNVRAFPREWKNVVGQQDDTPWGSR
jgi:hypothetical protein